MSTLEQAVYLDAQAIWDANNFEDENITCNCPDKLHVWLHVLDPTRNNGNPPEYKNRKASAAIGEIINKSNECLVCGHVWSSTNCTKYIKQIEHILKTVNVKLH